MRPRKYFCATMFVAVCDQNFGNSTSRCSNAGAPLPGISASRVSHSISSKGSRPGIVKNRRGATLASSSTTVLTTSCFLRCLRRLLGGGHAVLPGRDVEFTPRAGRAWCASCERTGHARTRVGRHRKSCKVRENRRPSTEEFYRSGGAGPSAAAREPRCGAGREQQAGEHGERDDRVRHATRSPSPLRRDPRRARRCRDVVRGVPGGRRAR